MKILRGDDRHPPRPDLPIVRHLTYREAHLFEVGLWPGIALALTLHAGEYGAALAVVAVIRRKMQDKTNETSNANNLRGYITDAWYFGGGALTAFLLMLPLGLLL